MRCLIIHRTTLSVTNEVVQKPSTTICQCVNSSGTLSVNNELFTATHLSASMNFVTDLSVMKRDWHSR